MPLSVLSDDDAAGVWDLLQKMFGCGYKGTWRAASRGGCGRTRASPPSGPSWNMRRRCSPIRGRRGRSSAFAYHILHVHTDPKYVPLGSTGDLKAVATLTAGRTIAHRPGGAAGETCFDEMVHTRSGQVHQTSSLHADQPLVSKRVLVIN